jgi:hypothetical protein
MVYYYLAARARVFRRIGSRDGLEETAARLLALQRADGSWANPSFLMKEDDPLIATSFALMALASARP